MRQIVLEAVRPLSDEVAVDALGNVLARRQGAGRKPMRVLLQAQMDEPGLMIVHDDGGGFFQFAPVGGIDEGCLAGKQVVVGRDHRPGVIGTRPIHLAADEQRDQPLKAAALRIDFGPGGKASVGERASFATRFRQSGPSLLARAIGGRIGVAILVELLKHAPRDIELCLAFTAQAEIGQRGTKAAAYAFDADLAIAVDSTPAHDLPPSAGGKDNSNHAKLGLGPAISMANTPGADDPRLVRLLVQTAEEEGIPYQVRQPEAGGRSTAVIQEARSGVWAASVSVPQRYPGAPISLARLSDWSATLGLLQAALPRMHARMIDE